MISTKTLDLLNESSLIRTLFSEGTRLKKIYGENNVFDFSIGNPSVYPPDKIKNTIIDILNNENQTSIHGYMNNSGFEDVRETIANYTNKKYNTSFTEKNITMTVGAAGALNIIFKTILNPNDEVIIIAPYFGEYKNYVNNFDGKIVVVPPDLNDFQINLDALKNSITKNTKALIINSPNNPSGVIYNENTLSKLSIILKEKEIEYNSDIFLIADEPYREIYYTDEKIPFVPDFYDNTLVAYSYSKSLSLPGERIGYIVTPSKIKYFEDITGGLNISNRVLGFVNAPSLFQKVIGKCIDLTVDITPYKENLDIFYDGLTSYGYEIIKPSGSFYLFPKTPIADDLAFCNKAKDYNILIVPGSAFGCPSYFRISYCTSKETVINSLPKFKELFDFFKQ